MKQKTTPFEIAEQKYPPNNPAELWRKMAEFVENYEKQKKEVGL